MGCEKRTACPGCGLFTWIEGHGCACSWCDRYQELVRDQSPPEIAR